MIEKLVAAIRALWSALSGAGVPAEAGGAVRSSDGSWITQQGFRVDTDPATPAVAAAVTLAVTRLAREDSGWRFGFGAPDPAIMSMLQETGLFAVVADPARLGTQDPGGFAPGHRSFGNGLWAATWPFVIAVGEGGSADPSNILLLKYAPGSLLELAADPSKWTQAEAFSGGATRELAAWIAAYVSAGCALAETNLDYQAFARTVTDPGWNGMLVLRPTVDLMALPAELSAMPSWLAGAPLHAHHCGFTSSLVGGGPPPWETISTFGLIDYEAPADAAATVSLWRLRVLVANSAVMKIDLQLAARPIGGHAPTPLAGRYAQAGDRRWYAFEPEAETCAIDSPEDRKRTLAEWFARLDPLLCGLAPPAAGAEVQIALTYEYTLHGGGGRSTLPVALVKGTIGEGLLVRDLAASALAWIETATPGTDGGAFGLACTVTTQPTPVGGMKVGLPRYTVALDRVKGIPAA